MRKNLLLLLFALTISACSASTPTEMAVTVEPTRPLAEGLPQTEADVPRVTVAEAKAAFDSGAAVIVDVRSTQAFVAQHIADALSIPLTQIEDNPKSVTLDKNQWIITYCT
ncbi:MAG: rhodanese-like domain-containing protein [Chloroflexota bacterium]